VERPRVSVEPTLPDSGPASAKPDGVAATGPDASATTDTGGSPAPRRRFNAATISNSLFDMQSNSVLIALVLVLGLFAVAHPSFFSLSQIQIVLQSSVYVGVMACGMAFLIAMRQLDLSVSSILALTAGIAALLMNQGWNPWLAALVAIIAAGAMGLFNGFLVQTIGIPALLATLATLYLYNGLNDGLTSSNTVDVGYTTSEVQIHGNHAITSSFFKVPTGNLIGIPVAAWLMFAIAAILTIVLRYTPFGYRVRSIGSNPEAAMFSGISIPRVRYQAFVLVGVVSGLAGLLVLIFFKDADPSVGGADNLLAIAAVIIGGTPMRGGSASVVGAMLGAILLSAVTSGLIYFNISENWSQFGLGAVILGAVSVDSIVRAGRRRAPLA
jgi:ribose transport system permease protein